MKIVIISDTHTQEHKVNLPKGDILIHGGDFDIRTQEDLDWIINWFKSLDYKHIVWIAGNHDFFMEKLYKNNIQPEMQKNIYYLCNSSIEIEGIKIWGSPFTPVFNDWAFMGYVDNLKKIWNTIPRDTDIILTHGQPFGINDVVNGISQGCPALRDKIKELKPKYYIGGHLHENYGIYQDENTTYINASLLDDYYNLVNEPVVIDYEQIKNKS